MIALGLVVFSGVAFTASLLAADPLAGAGSTRIVTPPAAPASTAPNAPITPPPTGPTSGNLASVHWSGNKVISTAVAYRNSSITISGGNLIVASGGVLTLDNDTLAISQANTSGLSALSHGLQVSAGGQLVAKYAVIQSGNGSSYPGFMDVAGAVHAFHVKFAFLGGSGSSPSAGREGVHVSAAHATFQYDVFDHTYQVLFDGSGAVGDQVTGSVWLNATITAGQIGWVEVAGGASWTNLTYDGWSGGKDAGMLALISGPHTTLANSTLIGDASGTQQYQVYLTYDGWTDTGVDASYASVVNDRFQTANLGISDGNQFVIEQDTFNDTGHWTSTGGAAAIIVVTWIGSGVGEKTRNVDIEHDTISNFTHYAVRVSQNVSAFNVSSNRIFATQSTYSTAITEADGIYLIRGVNNGTVWNNSLDMTDLLQPSEPTNGVVLEAQVNDVNVSANRIYNCSEVGITVQGDSGALTAPKYYLGPSSRDVLYGNRVVNYHTVAAQSMYSTEAIETWMWANGTRIQDNYIGGWNLVNTTNYWNGAGILTSSSEQTFTANTMAGVRFGFVFEKFDSQQELKRLGSFNRSYNVLNGNLLSGVTVDSLVENAQDDMGPIVNLVTGSVPASWSLWFSGSNASLRLVDPTLSSYAPSSPYRASNVRFVGPVTLANLSTAYDFAWSQWLSSPGVVRFGNFQAQFVTTTGWYNVSVSSYTPATGAVQWNATQTGASVDSFQVGTAVVGSTYSLSVDAVVTTNLTATGTSVSLAWTGSGTHRFAIAVTSGSTGGGVPPLYGYASVNHPSGAAPLKVRFAANASGGKPPYAYAWKFGDGDSSAVQNPSHDYMVPGTYRAALTVTDSAGRHANASLTILVTVHPLQRLTSGAAVLPAVPSSLASAMGPNSRTSVGSGAAASWLADGGWLAGLGAVAAGGAALATFRWRRA